MDIFHGNPDTACMMNGAGIDPRLAAIQQRENAQYAEHLAVYNRESAEAFIESQRMRDLQLATSVREANNTFAERLQSVNQFANMRTIEDIATAPDEAVQFLAQNAKYERMVRLQSINPFEGRWEIPEVKMEERWQYQEQMNGVVTDTENGYEFTSYVAPESSTGRAPLSFESKRALRTMHHILDRAIDDDYFTEGDDDVIV